jgi:hypothetical protein
MKILCSIILLLTAIFFSSSCQKDFSFEAGYAKGLLEKTPTGDCSIITVTGSYQKDTLLKTSTNYVDIQVNISQTGRYFIKTDTVNGYSFSAADIFTVVGLNTVRLLASGRPKAASLDVFTVKYDTSSCQFKAVVTEGGPTPVSASFTLNCALAAFAGTYGQGIPTAAANIITLPVTVINGGPYSITTSNNGVMFSGSGILSAAPSAQTITLHATLNNIPAAAGSFSYSINAGGGPECTVNITYSASPVFTADSIVAIIDSLYTNFKISDSAKLDNTSIPGYAGIRIKGYNNLAGNETFFMAIAREGSSIAAGTYTINNFPASINATKYSTTTASFSAATNLISGTLQNFGFNIIITTVTRTNITGTFSGRLLANGVGPTYKTVTNGIFSVTIYP